MIHIAARMSMYMISVCILSSSAENIFFLGRKMMQAGNATEASDRDAPFGVRHGHCQRHGCPDDFLDARDGWVVLKFKHVAPGAELVDLQMCAHSVRLARRHANGQAYPKRT